MVKTAIDQAFVPQNRFIASLILDGIWQISLHIPIINSLHRDVFLLNSRGLRFSVTYASLRLHGSSYSINLQGQLAEFLNKYSLFALVYSTYEPVAVYGTVN